LGQASQLGPTLYNFRLKTWIEETSTVTSAPPAASCAAHGPTELSWHNHCDGSAELA
jgi:hypothetical protein